MVQINLSIRSYRTVLSDQESLKDVAFACIIYLRTKQVCVSYRKYFKQSSCSLVVVYGEDKR